MNKSLRYLAAAGLIGGGCWMASAWGQESTPPAGGTYPVPSGQRFGDDAVPQGAYYSAEQPRRPGETKSLTI